MNLFCVIIKFNNNTKLVTNKKVAMKLGLIRDENFKSTDELWMKILRKKYSIKYFSDLLKSTDDIYLLEFYRGANRKLIHCGSFWGKINM